ncbi:accessory gene regulator protein A [Lysinibacillus alkalisoli]|uniref:Accessory gene regulator protein A n=1 Tax=Lysinibacillus alkalisoli TaxID=1911548 RepID=A0A917D2Y8_9BACI|nr:LytTR family DNA-binding domain-containing protein [Lysinibacillus alkalisoli]GGG10345.1 accessory gene regulator protein A [Lysinibacillus alkalisoli]
MKIVLCEDHEQQRLTLESIIQNYILFHLPYAQIVLSTSTPEDVLTFNKVAQADVYILDIDLQHEIDGITLAKQIKNANVLAVIIFITSHANRWRDTFIYKVQALDFVIKSSANQEAQVQQALQAAAQYYQQLGKHASQAQVLQLTIGDSIKNIALRDVYSIEAAAQPHKLILCARHGYYEWYGKLSDYENIVPYFIRCHRSCMVNLHFVSVIDRKKRTLLLDNGIELPVAIRKMKAIIQQWQTIVSKL